MPKDPIVERWVKWMNVNLNMLKNKSKFTFGWNSIKEFKHGKDKFKGWKAYKSIMVSEKVEASAKGTKAFTTWAYSSTSLKVKLQWRWWCPKWEEREDVVNIVWFSHGCPTFDMLFNIQCWVGTHFNR